MDFALGQFMKNAEDSDYFDNTLFVVYGDHGSRGYHLNKAHGDLTINEYNVPLIFYGPGLNILPSTYEKVASEIDIFPTIFSLLNISYENRSIGRNIFSNNENDGLAFLFSAASQRYALLSDSQLIIHSYPELYLKKKLKLKYDDHSRKNVDRPTVFLFDLMDEYNVPQPKYARCSSKDAVVDIKNNWGFPIVIKADGLAAGKGVIICKTEDELESAIELMINQKKFGNAASKISVEECLKGEELSIFAICDGESYQFINSAQDHKRIFNDDKGPNTGGMGAYCPTPLFTEDLKGKVEESILKPILYAMKQKGHPFKGFLYIGLMIVDDEPFVIEFNVRLGDPEAQVLLPLIQSSVFKMMQDAVNGNINENHIKLSDEYAVTVVLAASGYPDKYNKNMVIEGLNLVKDNLVFHAGTSYDNGKYYSNGGRVLNVVGKHPELSLAIKKAYNLLEKINFKDKYYRTDIGRKGLKYLDEKY